MRCGSGATGYGLAWVLHPGGYGHRHPTFELPAGARGSLPTSNDIGALQLNAGRKLMHQLLPTFCQLSCRVVHQRENDQNMTSMTPTTSLCTMHHHWTHSNPTSIPSVSPELKLSVLAEFSDTGRMLALRDPVWLKWRWTSCLLQHLPWMQNEHFPAVVCRSITFNTESAHRPSKLRWPLVRGTRPHFWTTKLPLTSLVRP